MSTLSKGKVVFVEMWKWVKEILKSLKNMNGI